MRIFRKKCEYCRTKIEKRKEVEKDVKVPGYIGTYPKDFCCKEHFIKYEQELEEYTKKSKNVGGGCCG